MTAFLPNTVSSMTVQTVWHMQTILPITCSVPVSYTHLQLDGFGQEQPQPSVKFPVFHSETVAVYPGDKNNLPYDVVRCV